MSTAPDRSGTAQRPSKRRPRQSLVTLTAVLALGVAMTGSAQGATVVSIDAGADAAVLEGGTLTRSIPIVDGEDNGVAGWSFSVDYGDGSAAVVGSTLTPSIELNHVYADGPASHTVSVSVTDTIDEVAADSFVVTVNNVAPIPVLTGNATSNEGATYTLAVNGTDPAGASDPLEFTIDWGDGTISAQVLRPVGTITHVFADDEDGPIDSTVRLVRVGLWDGDAFVAALFPVAVNNVAPTIALSGAAIAEVGSPYSLTLGAVTDPGRDTTTARVIRWGDGTTETTSVGGTFAHTYATSGSRTVVVDLVDEDGTFLDAGTLTVQATVSAPTAPISLTATALSRSSIRLGWTNTTSNQTEVVIERCRGLGCTSFTRVATLPGTATAFTNTGLRSRTSYTYRIRSRNAGGYSTYSTTATVRTLR